jgi:hypothetical protein
MDSSARAEFERRTRERQQQRWWHLGQHDPVARFTCWLAICTTVLAVITAVSVVVLWRTDHTLKETLEASSRAWVVPTGAKIDGPIRAGTSFRVKILFENSGKQPAQNTFNAWAWNEIPIKTDMVGVPYIGVEETPWPARHLQCSGGAPNTGGRPVYPGSRNEDMRYIFNGNPAFVPQSLLEKTSSFVIFGCYIYRTFEKPAHSPYCFFFQPHRDRPIEDSTMEFCPISYGVAD